VADQAAQAVHDHRALTVPLIVVSGAPSTGKSTIAAALGAALRFPVRARQARATAVRQLGGEELGGVMDSDVRDSDAAVAPLRLPAGENVGDLHPAGQVVLGSVHGSSLGVSMPVARLFRFYWTGVT
jgi:adenylylsulfate kinase-like enzyme